MTRAEASGIRLSVGDACQVLGMLERGDRQHDIAIPGESHKSRLESYFRMHSPRHRKNSRRPAHTILAEQPQQRSRR
jgi:hypothetical protein